LPHREVKLHLGAQIAIARRRLNSAAVRRHALIAS
jgi:hypothetical protein